jgi:hypothetical protein
VITDRVLSKKQIVDAFGLIGWMMRLPRVESLQCRIDRRTHACLADSINSMGLWPACHVEKT